MAFFTKSTSHRNNYYNKKFLSDSMKKCYICQSNDIDIINLNLIRNRNTKYANYFPYGRRSLSEKYSFKYNEDNPLNPKSNYISRDTKELELWTICQCKKRAHPDCLLESFKVTFNLKCDECDSYFKIGFVNEKSKKRKLILSIILLSLIDFTILLIALILLSVSQWNYSYQETSNRSFIIRITKALGLILICLFLCIIIIISFKLCKLLTASKEISSYLLPYVNKYELTYGFEKYQLNKYCKMSKSEIIEEIKPNMETEENLISSSRLDNPFFNRLFTDISFLKNKTLEIKKSILSNYDFEYSLPDFDIKVRAYNYLKCFLNLEIYRNYLNSSKKETKILVS